MNCQQTRRLLHGYIDGELDLAGSLAVEDHLRACADCRAHHAGHRALSRVVAEQAGSYAAPDNLVRQIERDVRKAGRPAGGARWSGVWLAAAAFVVTVGVWLAWPGAGEEAALAQRVEKVVYHINNPDDAANALRNVANHLETSPKARIVVVAHNNGVDFLLQGARDATGHPYQTAVAQLVARGVDFRVCKITLVRREVDLGRVIPQASLVPSGIAEITRLQVKEGYAYLKP